MAIAWLPYVAEAETTLLVANARFHGEIEGDYFGFTVAGGGDIDGDGFADTLLGAPNNAGGGTDNGQVYVFLGAAGGWGGTVDGAAADASFLGENHGSLGTVLAIAPDVNGDGRDDLLMGSSGLGTGRVYVVFGRSGGWAFGEPVTAADALFIGDGAGDAAGGAVAGAGDVDGDGFGDLVIGSTGVSGYAGQATLVLGKASGWAVGVALSNADVSFTGEGAGDWAGDAVAGAGDVDGDGYDDVLISADGWSGHVGKVYLVLGRDDGWVASVPLAGADASFVGEATGDYAGRSIAGAGDMNGDGYDDILVGAYDDSAGDAGIVYLILGRSSGWGADTSLATADGSFVGDLPGDNLGVSISGAGDVDGDGLADILLGASSTDDPAPGCGSAVVFLGQSGFGWDTPASDADGWYAGVSEDEQMGNAVAWAGDVDGDGYDDLLVGTQLNDDFGENAGIVAWIAGFPDEDQDGDGWSTWNGDCDDVDASLNHDDADGDGNSTCDGDCDDQDPSLQDLDLDGDGYSVCDGDCDDLDWFFGPASPELCNGLDDDCDGAPAPYETDHDGDGYMECADCDDADANVYPGAPEICGDGVDGDCAGDLVGTEQDDDGDGYAECEGDCNDDDAGIHPGAQEVCNDGVDDDCDPLTDEETDHDGDGYGPCDADLPDCDDGDVGVHPGATEVCDGVDNDCDGGVDDIDHDGDGYSACGGDCDDADPGVHPDVDEIPYDDVDHDCDGADLGDVDGDGFEGGDAGEDCDDAAPEIHPGADEVPYDGVDQDCDGADLDDVDGDGFDVNMDCHDRDADVHPGAAEDCTDGLDNDCDQLVDLWDSDCDVPDDQVDEPGCSCRQEREGRPSLMVVLVSGLLFALVGKRAVR